MTERWREIVRKFSEGDIKKLKPLLIALQWALSMREKCADDLKHQKDQSDKKIFKFTSFHRHFANEFTSVSSISVNQYY